MTETAKYSNQYPIGILPLSGVFQENGGILSQFIDVLENLNI